MRRFLAMGLVLAAAAAVSGCSTGFAGSPTYVTDASATINGLVATTDGGQIDYWVQYGLDQSYNYTSTIRHRTVPAKSSFVISIPIGPLAPSTTYHYQVCTADSCSDDAMFTTDSPGGRSGIAFSSNRGPGSGGYETDVVAMPASGGSVTNLTNASTSADSTPTWSPDGRQIAYVLQRNSSPLPITPIYAMNADGTDKHALTGNGYHGSPAWSPDGKRIAYTGLGGPNFQTFVMDADGNHQHNVSNSNTDELDPSWSPDGSRIAYARASADAGRRDIWVMNADGSGKTPLTSTPYLDEEAPAWSPDGTKIAFTLYRGIHTFTTVYVMDADGSNPVAVTSEAAPDDLSPTWSPDGSKIAFRQGSDIFAVNAAGGTPVNLTNDAFIDTDPAWSPRP